MEHTSLFRVYTSQSYVEVYTKDSTLDRSLVSWESVTFIMSKDVINIFSFMISQVIFRYKNNFLIVEILQ